MKHVFALTLLVNIFAAGTALANGPEETFVAEQLTHWMSGADDVILGRVKDTCNQTEQNSVMMVAQNAALAKCNASPRGYRCFSASSVITYNGPLNQQMMDKYGLQHNPFTLNTPRGCEATATAFGFR